MADALPAGVIQRWHFERDAWLKEYGIDPADENWRESLEDLPEKTIERFHRTFTRRMHEFLDAGHGECLLRQPELRLIIADSLMHWDGQRCLLAGWVIMPNHVHVLVQPLAGHTLLTLCQSWKHWAARRINAQTARTGRFWQTESWDHLLRHPAYLTKFRRYIRLNPVKAKLRPDEYELWLPEIEGLQED
jgi:REP element-mobilizing transposase RayT